jgi:hypothetical protein
MEIDVKIMRDFKNASQALADRAHHLVSNSIGKESGEVGELEFDDKVDMTFVDYEDGDYRSDEETISKQGRVIKVRKDVNSLLVMVNTAKDDYDEDERFDDEDEYEWVSLENIYNKPTLYQGIINQVNCKVIEP